MVEELMSIAALDIINGKIWIQQDGVVA